MDFLPIAVLILFVLLGGFIAVVADELGRRIGKRRLSLHRRIRPKTTARIITFCSGMIITLSTIGLITAASSDVRAWLREGNRAIKQRDLLQADVNGLRKEQDTLAGENSTLRSDNQNLTATRIDLQRKVKEQQKTLGDLQQKLTRSQDQVASAQGKIGSLNARVASLNSSISAKTRERDAAEQTRRIAQASLKKLNAQYKRLSKDYRDLSLHEIEIDQKLRVKEREVAAKQTEIDAKTKQIEQADEAIARLNTDKQRLQAEIDQTEQDLDGKQAQLFEARQQLAIMQNKLNANVTGVRLKPLMFRMGEELTRLTIPAGTSKEQAKDKIEAALAKAKDVAKDKGAKNDKVPDYVGMTDLVDPQMRPISVATQKNMLASQMAGHQDEQVLIVYSIANAFLDEGVLVGLEAKANPVIYQPGQALAEVRIDGRQDAGKILQGLDGLGARIRTRAINDKMIPIQKPDASLGSVSSEDILHLFEDIKKSGNSVRVQARAKRLTRAADPLLLDFEVK